MMNPDNLVTAILQVDNKKDRLIYSSPGLGAATTSNGSAVSRSVSNNVGAEQNVLPTSDKSSGLSNLTIPYKQVKGNEKREINAIAYFNNLHVDIFGHNWL